MQKSHHAFTLMEMLVTITVVSLILVAITNSVLMFYRSNRSSLEESLQIRSAERGMQVLVRDLREATYGDDGAYPLASIASTSVVFYSDIDQSAPVERIAYSVSGKRLTRTITNSSGTPPQYVGSGVTSVVSEYIRNIEDNIVLFRYYDSSGIEVTNSVDIAKIVSVSISLVVDITPVHAPGEFTLKSTASLRNLRPQ